MYLSIPAFFPAVGQTETGGQVIDSTGIEAPKAIPTQDLIQKIEEAVEETKVIGRKIEANDDLVSLDTLFPAYVKFIQREMKLTESFISSNPSFLS